LLQTAPNDESRLVPIADDSLSWCNRRLVARRELDLISIDRVGTMEPETRYAKSGDVGIAYQVFGEGPINLVLAPFFVSNVEHFWDDPSISRWLLRLASFARVAMFDKRGTGMSDRVSEMPGLDQRMDDLRAVMDAAGMEQAAVMGLSEGGSLAALFAATYPNRCTALVLCAVLIVVPN
jgi:pimeloyl-ACP methyl ester carboxylesterase